jgi:hypothetical protein
MTRPAVAASSPSLPRTWAFRSTRRLAVGCGLGITLPLLWLLSADTGRSYNYDESVAVGTIISTGSPLRALTHQILFNNHPLFAAVQSGWWALGARTEAVQRVPPIAYGVAAVAMLTVWLAVRWGAAAAMAGGAVLASNPMFVDLARTVRGYSLTVLASVMALVGIAEYARDHRRRWLILHGAGIVIGVGTHLFAVVPLGIIAVAAAVVIGVDRWLAITWSIALTGVAVVYGTIIDDMRATARDRGRRYRPALGGEVVRDLLGQRIVVMALLGSLGVFGVFALFARSRRIGWGAVVAVAVAVGSVVVIWRVIQPSVLHSRYFVGMLPLVAIAVAAGVRHAPPLCVPLALAVTLLTPRLLDIRNCEVPIRQVAETVDAARALHLEACLAGGDSLSAYTSRPREVRIGEALAGCDLFVRIGSWGVPMVAEAREHFAYEWSFGGRFEAFAQRPPAELDVRADVEAAEAGSCE